MDYRYGSHTVYNIEYHFVWVTKYRDKVLTGDVALRVRELVCSGSLSICDSNSRTRVAHRPKAF